MTDGISRRVIYSVLQSAYVNSANHICRQVLMHYWTGTCRHTVTQDPIYYTSFNERATNDQVHSDAKEAKIYEIERANSYCLRIMWFFIQPMTLPDLKRNNQEKRKMQAICNTNHQRVRPTGRTERLTLNKMYAQKMPKSRQWFE